MQGNPVVTISCYYKVGPGGYTYDPQIQWYDSGVADYRAWFEVTGTVITTSGTSGGVVETGVIDVGDGWYRCYMVVDRRQEGAVHGAFQPRFRLSQDSISTHDGESIYLWGVQIEPGVSVPSDYVEKDDGVKQ